MKIVSEIEKAALDKGIPKDEVELGLSLIFSSALKKTQSEVKISKEQGDKLEKIDIDLLSSQDDFVTIFDSIVSKDGKVFSEVFNDNVEAMLNTFMQKIKDL